VLPESAFGVRSNWIAIRMNLSAVRNRIEFVF